MVKIVLIRVELVLIRVGLVLIHVELVLTRVELVLTRVELASTCVDLSLTRAELVHCCRNKQGDTGTYGYHYWETALKIEIVKAEFVKRRLSKS